MTVTIAAGGTALFVWRRMVAAQKAKEQAALLEAERQRAWEHEQQRLAAETAAAAERQHRRWEDLVARFGEENARRILSKELWVGATREMIVEAFGHPEEVTERVLKTKTKRIYKYDQLGRGRFGLRITLENDTVVGWERAD